MKRVCTLLFLIALSASAQTSAPGFDGKSWWNIVKVLADNNMEGRETGSKGLAKAEAWVVKELKGAGISPAGENGGYYQAVRFTERSINEQASSLALVRDGNAEPLTLGEDASFGLRVDLAPSIEAPLVFAGHGLQIPEKNYDDLAGLDLKGKVVVVVPGAPAEIPGALAAHAQSAAERWKVLNQAGALGVISIPNPDSMDIPWSRMSLNRTHPAMVLAEAAMDETAGEKLQVTFNPAHAEKLFAGSGHTWEEVLAVLRQKKQLPRFPLAASIRAKTQMMKRQVTSNNIVAKLEGSDQQLKNEYVVVSAHIDHVGIGNPINGDKIYNGAMDNASGSAALLEIAKNLKASGAKLKRSVLFTWVTAEEKGLLGSRHFAVHPTVPKEQIVADVNMDMFLPIVPLKVMTVLGLNESDLADWAAEVAQKNGVQAEADPQPQRNTFIRSDQYSFIREGVPSIALKVGFTKENVQVQQDWLHHRYHAPSDDLSQPVDLESAAKFETIVRDIVVAAANADKRPEWKQDSFFRRYAKK